MSEPEMVRLDDEASRLLAEMADELPGNPAFTGVTSEAIKQYYEQTYLSVVGGETANPR
jgi:hypothetical protein